MSTRRRGCRRDPGTSICRPAYPLSVALFWDRLIGAQGAPPGWVIAASAAAALLIVVSPRLWRLARIVITIAHESGHAAASGPLQQRL